MTTLTFANPSEAVLVREALEEQRRLLGQLGRDTGPVARLIDDCHRAHRLFDQAHRERLQAAADPFMRAAIGDFPNGVPFQHIEPARCPTIAPKRWLLGRWLGVIELAGLKPAHAAIHAQRLALAVPETGDFNLSPNAARNAIGRAAKWIEAESVCPALAALIDRISVTRRGLLIYEPPTGAPAVLTE